MNETTADATARTTDGTDGGLKPKAEGPQRQNGGRRQVLVLVRENRQYGEPCDRETGRDPVRTWERHQ